MYTNYLYHHGIKGQKWGVRRYQNEDGSVTAAGAKRYYKNGKEANNSKPEIRRSSRDYTSDWDGTNWKIDETTIKTNRNNQQKKAELDKMADDEDYDEADKFDTKAMEVLDAYMDHGEEAALKVLDEKFGDYDIEFVITHEKELVDDGEDYTSFALKVIGNNSIYNTAGDNWYSDDQYFTKK